MALQEQQEAALSEMQSLVAGATALPRQQVQPRFAALGKRHLALKQQYLKLQHLSALISAIISHIGEQWMHTQHVAMARVTCIAYRHDLMFCCHVVQ